MAMNPFGTGALKVSISGSPLTSGSAHPTSSGRVDVVGPRFFGRGCVVSSDAAYVGESGAITDIVRDVAAGLSGVDVESPQRVGGHPLGCVVGPQLADEVVGTEPCEPMWGLRLRRPLADEHRSGSALPHATAYSASAVAVEDDSFEFAPPSNRDRRRPSGDVVDVEGECFRDLQSVAHDECDERFEAGIERGSHSSTTRYSVFGELHGRARVS